MYNCGKMDKKIQIWGKVETLEKDEIGQAIIEDAIIGNPFAEIVPKTGSLLSGRAADTVLSKTTHMIKIRYNSKYEYLKPDTNWIMLNKHRYNIEFVLNPYSKNEFLEIFCNELI